MVRRRRLAIPLRVGLVLSSLCAGCGLDSTMETTPNPVVVGSPLTFVIEVRNRALCAVDDVELVLEPLVDTNDPDVAQMCAVAAMQAPSSEFADPGTLESLAIPALAHQTVKVLSVEIDTGMIECSAPAGSEPVTCAIGTMQAQEVVTVRIVLTPTRPGRFFNVQMVTGVASASCQDSGAEAMDMSCTETTVLAARATPLLSPWLLAALAAALGGLGTYGVHRLGALPRHR